MVRSALIAGLFAVIAAGPGVAQETPDDEALAVVARVGPWPVASGLIGFAGRLWFVNSVKYGNHNSADIYSLDPVGGAPRYERRLFSQDGTLLPPPRQSSGPCAGRWPQSASWRW